MAPPDSAPGSEAATGMASTTPDPGQRSVSSAGAMPGGAPLASASAMNPASPGVAATSEALYAAWQRTRADAGLDGGSEVSAKQHPGGGDPTRQQAALGHGDVPALSIDPALDEPVPPEDEALLLGGDVSPEQLTVIPDALHPGEELVLGPDGEPIDDAESLLGPDGEPLDDTEWALGPDGEPLEDTGLVLDDTDPERTGADAGTGLAPHAIPFAPDAGSLRVRRSIVVRQEPRQKSPALGTVAQDMRVRWQGETAIRGPDCEAWVQIEPRGWVCERYLEPNFREPRVRELPKLREGELTPGVYARVVGKRVRAYPSLALARARRKGVLLKGSVTVQLRGQVRIRRKTYWRTADGQYLEARVLREYRPSAFEGVNAEAIAELPPTFAWAQSRVRPSASVEVRAAPDAKAARETVLPPRTLVAVKELSEDGHWVSIAEGHWVARDDLHVAWFTHAPPEVAPGSRWLDVDLDAQVLVAYEGERPVYATLISSGKQGTDTPEGLFRIWIKFAEADMTGSGTAGNETYRVATVPWTMFFQDDYALHTAYWHDRFGEPMSHGCVNLSPKDARLLYAWAAPEVPTGWSMVHATADTPGSWVRIRGQARPTGKAARKVAVASTQVGAP
ncbi:L,D-transpeptidase family protein [Comamonas sp. JC664]|uniref:L,D-transpeptidase family protein n=1 Tax=Comamonas sp. JC664 TaxID=2801917 RepID=UPI00191FC0CF|nr:L,D-transpeptidase family protein [Comamonas sp. JC664]MBL0697540.1 L,D-transpeptidase family protein [Comamonas sp. JC664]